jgi:hypothetical protein
MVYDAVFNHPTNDWRLLDLFTAALSENASRGQLSINQTNLAAWSAVLSGVLALTNTVTDAQFADDPFRLPQFAPWVIEPVGTDGPLSPVQRIVDGILRERTNLAVSIDVAGRPLANYVHPNATFRRLGEILAVPELTVTSPFLNQSTAVQTTKGISDPVYERIPQQILSLLRVGEPRFVIYAYGQSLKPADQSIVTSGPYFGLCTNYQITAEVATRSVVRVEGSPDPRDANNRDPLKRYPPRVVVESFNTLPPD